jgi:signal transduction histidine kinase
VTRVDAATRLDAAGSWLRRHRTSLVDVLVAAAATGVEIGLVVDGWPDYTPTAILLSVLSGALLTLRRAAPLAVLAATMASTAAVVATSGGGFAGGAPPVVALFTVAELRGRWTAVAALAPTAVLLQVWAVSQPAVCAIAVIAGAYLQTRRRYTAALEERSAQLERERDQLDRIAAQRERASIARELHDIVAHSVTVMLLGVRGARDVLRTQPEVADDALRRVETSGEASLAELRRILTLLRDDADRAGAAAPADLAPAPSLARLDELAGHFRDAGLPVRVEITGDRRPLPGGVELSAYRIVEEALTNVAKHSRMPGDVAVRLHYTPAMLEVRVEDDGEPRHPADGDLAREPGHGIAGMRERAAALGGRLETGVRPGGGFRVAADLPVGDAT